LNKAVLSLLLLLLFFSVVTEGFLVDLASANFIIYLPTITINTDGTIEPKTEFITNCGSIYSLTADLPQKYAITIRRSNIIFDGQGHIINGSISYGSYANSGIKLEGVTNVTVKNVQLMGFSINFENCFNCSLIKGTLFYFNGFNNSQFNKILESNIAICQLVNTQTNTLERSNVTNELVLYNANNNLISANNISKIDIYDSGSNTFFANNFLGLSENTFRFENKVNDWDNGSLGNYWNNYLKKYPEASEIANSGVGNTSYIIDNVNIDHYPLMTPFNISLLESQPNTTQQHQAPFPFLLIIVFISSGVIGFASIIFFIRKCKSKRT
jgi:hypothetical protein